LRVAFYHSNRDNVPKSADLTWGQLAEVLTQHQMTPCAPCGGHDCALKFGRAWSPADLDVRRTEPNVRSIGALVLDFDGLSETLARDALQRLSAFTNIVYTTHSHAVMQLEQPPRFSFRAVIQLSRSVAAADWRGFLARAVTYLGVAAFPGIAECGDLSRLYFLPTASVGSRPVAAAHDGVAMNVDAIMALPAPPIATTAPRAVAAVNVPGIVWQDPATVDLEALRKALRSVSNETSKPLAQAILKGEAVGWSDAQRRQGAPQLGRDHGLQRASSLVAWACPLGTPLPALFELLRPTFNGMDLAPEGPDYWRAEIDDMLRRAVARKAEAEARENLEHQRLLDVTFGPGFGPDNSFKPVGSTPSAAGGTTGSVPVPAFAPLGGAPALSPAPARDLLDELCAQYAGAGPPVPTPAVASLPAAPVESEGDASWTKALLYKTDKNGNQTELRGCPANASTILRHDTHWRGMVRRNEFTGAAEIWGGPIFQQQPPKPLPVTDEHVTKIAMWLQQRPEIAMRFDISTQSLYEVINAVASDHSYHPIRDYCDEVEWDGAPRLDSWLETYLGAKLLDAAGEDITAYVRAAAAKWLIAAVARVYEPGCKVQNVLILEGEQGLRKSTAFEVLASRPFFTDQTMDIGHKDTSIATTKNWIVELAELDAFRKSEHTQAKAFFTRDWESYRPPYGRHEIKRPRVCIFGGTSNRDDYLTDPTGNRRYWPVVCTKVDVAALERDRDQLWAEAVARYQAGKAERSDCLWWLTKAEEEIAFRAAEERVAPDDWEDKILRWWAQVAGRPMDVRIGTVLEIALGFTADKMHHGVSTRAGACLKKLGFTRKRKREAGRLLWYYEPGGALANVQTAIPAGVMGHLSMLPGGA